MTTQEKIEILDSKLKRLFPDRSERQKVMEILLTYGTESYEREPDRVRLAILKLSGNSLDEIKKYTQYAKQDFRDILCWAEYPNQGKAWNLKDQAEKQRLADRDRKQYEDWLGR